MSKPSAGPWKWYWFKAEGEAACGVYNEDNNGTQRTICKAPRYQTREQWEADAKLIAAAPDLLAACTVAKDTIDGMLEALDDVGGDYDAKKWLSFCDAFDVVAALS